MHIVFACLLFAAPVAAMAQDEDAAHRSDRLRTADLNRNAGQAIERRDAANAASLRRYHEAESAYQRQREAWRRRFAACEAGDERACDPGY
jgi:hypothetical protein